MNGCDVHPSARIAGSDDRVRTASTDSSGTDVNVDILSLPEDIGK